MRMLGKLAYGALFCLLLPAILVAMAWSLDRRLDSALPVQPWIGVPIAFAGFVLLAGAIAQLMVLGRGLPMNAYPTTQRVESGLYGWFAHPIYLGFVVMVLGVSISAGSGSGLFILTSWATLASMALVVGYEGPATERRLGARQRAAATSLPGNWPLPVAMRQRFGALLAVFGPWLVVYCAFAALPPAPNAFSTYLPFEIDWPFWPSFVVVYSFTYVFAAAIPFLVPDLAALRRFMLAGWSGTLIGGLIFATVPAVAPLRGIPPDNFIGWWLQVERAQDGITAAFPSFHAFWIIVALPAWRRILRWPLTCALALAQLAACHLTGMHSLADLVLGIVLAGLCLRIEPIWHGLLRLAETVANEWRPVRLGAARFFPHGLYVLAAGIAGFLVTAALAPGVAPAWLALLAVAGLVGAILFGQFVEASTILARPLGFSGGLAGAALASIVLYVAGRIDANTVAAAAIGLCIVQMIGRLRCLAQGCCHGRLLRWADGAAGLTYRHRLSRVTLVAGLAGRPITPAPVVSVLANLATLALLVFVDVSVRDAWLVVALYCVLMGTLRFAEEGLRGEPQTPARGGLNLYQWLGLAVAVIGFALAFGMPLETTHAAHWPGLSECVWALVSAIPWVVAMSVDWPESSLPLSRLTPGK